MMLGHRYTNVIIHALFSTKDCKPLLSAEVKSELLDYLGSSVNRLGGQSIAVNGMADHVHMLFVQPAALSLLYVMEKIKANSLGWVKRRWTYKGGFGWQTGYAAFSVSKSDVDRVKQYIAEQEEHHRKITFQEEVLQLTSGPDAIPSAAEGREIAQAINPPSPIAEGTVGDNSPLSLGEGGPQSGG